MSTERIHVTYVIFGLETPRHLADKLLYVNFDIWVYNDENSKFKDQRQ